MDRLLPFFFSLPLRSSGGWRDALPARGSCSDIAASSPQTLICPHLPGLPWPASLRHLSKLFRCRPGGIRSPLPLRAPRDAGQAAAGRAPQPSSGAPVLPARLQGTAQGLGGWKWGSHSPAPPSTPNRDRRRGCWLPLTMIIRQTWPRQSSE